jgi:hypothetical protein
MSWWLSYDLGQRLAIVDIDTRLLALLPLLVFLRARLAGNSGSNNVIGGIE